jgi:hypothetical protein
VSQCLNGCRIGHLQTFNTKSLPERNAQTKNYALLIGSLTLTLLAEITRIFSIDDAPGCGTVIDFLPALI